MEHLGLFSESVLDLCFPQHSTLISRSKLIMVSLFTITTLQTEAVTKERNRGNFFFLWSFTRWVHYVYWIKAFFNKKKYSSCRNKYSQPICSSETLVKMMFQRLDFEHWFTSAKILKQVDFSFNPSSRKSLLLGISDILNI